MRIVLCYPVDDRHTKQIQSVWPDAEVIAAEQAQIAELLPTAHIFCGHAKLPVDWPAVVAAGNLKWIQSSAAGLDHCLVPEVIAAPIVVTSASGLFAAQVGEQTMALLLALVRRLPAFWQAQGRREFVRRPTDDLHGKTVGIVGFGGNGRRIARLLAAFQARIIATDMFPHDCPSYVDQLWPADHLRQLCRQADVLVLTVPLTETTRAFINAEILATLKPGAVLINVARGQVVDEPALIASLRSGHLAAAGLDVTATEPLPSVSPLWDMPNVVITPHVAAQSATRIDDTTNFFCENLRRYRHGVPLLNLVNKELGFPVPPSASVSSK